MRYLTLLLFAVSAGGCALFEDVATQAFVADRVNTAMDKAAEGKYIQGGIEIAVALAASIYGVNKMRNRARSLRGEPVDTVARPKV